MPYVRTSWSIVVALVAFALTGCGAAPPAGEAQTWLGTTTFAEAAYDLSVDVVLDRQGAWTGTYTVGSTPPFAGSVDATLENGALSGMLEASNDCRFALEGTIDDGTLEATFTPTECDGGSAGTWSATKQ